MIYLDNGASTRPFDEVTDLVAKVMREDFGNPASAHAAGASARRRIEEARAHVLAAIGDADGRAGELVWTSSGTESDAIGLIGAARARGVGAAQRGPDTSSYGGGGAVVVTDLEHDAVLRSAEQLGVALTVAPATAAGTVDVERLLEAVTPDTAVVALMRVQNEIGTLQPVAEIARAVHARAPACHVHCDAVQALGKVPVDVVALGVDSAAFAAHKLHGPKGVGAVWLRHGARVEPLWGGGGHQGGRRAGTLDAPGAAGFGLAAARTTADLPTVHARWARFAALVRSAAASTGVEHMEVPPKGVRAPHILPIAFRGVSAAALRNTLASRGVAVSAGSACASISSSGDAKPSRTLAAVGLPPDWGMVRVSFGHDTTAADVDVACEILVGTVRDLARKTS